MRSAELKHKPTSIMEDLKVIGLVFSLVFSLITLVVILILDFVKWVRTKNVIISPKGNEHTEVHSF